MTRRARNRADDRLAALEALAAQRVRLQQATRAQYAEHTAGVSSRERLHDERFARLSEQLLEVARLEAEGNAPPERLKMLRWVADESFRQGKPVGEAEYAKAHAAPPAPAADAEMEEALAREPREWEPKPPGSGDLRDYRDRRLNSPTGFGSIEPELT